MAIIGVGYNVDTFWNLINYYEYTLRSVRSHLSGITIGIRGSAGSDEGLALRFEPRVFAAIFDENDSSFSFEEIPEARFPMTCLYVLDSSTGRFINPLFIDPVTAADVPEGTRDAIKMDRAGIDNWYTLVVEPLKTTRKKMFHDQHYLQFSRDAPPVRYHFTDFAFAYFSIDEIETLLAITDLRIIVSGTELNLGSGSRPYTNSYFTLKLETGSGTVASPADESTPEVIGGIPCPPHWR